jgi:hypothetical protein
MDVLVILLSGSIFLLYGSICSVGLIFTFALNLYHKIDNLLDLNIVRPKTLTPLEKNVYRIDDWLIAHNKIVGPLLTLLGLIDLKLSFNIINQL